MNIFYLNVKNFLKLILRFFGIRYLKSRDNPLFKDLKSKFQHSEREFRNGSRRYFVDCLSCYACPGVLETIILNFPSGKKVLNLGGGIGQVSDIIRYLGKTVVNVDLEISNEDNFNVKYDLNSNVDLNLNDEKFDIILCQEVIEHIENPWKLFRLFRKFLKNDGIIILTTPNIQSKYSKELFFKFGFFHWFSPEHTEWHINPLPIWEVNNIAKKNGFQINSVISNSGYYFKKSDPIRDGETLIFFISFVKNSELCI